MQLMQSINIQIHTIYKQNWCTDFFVLVGTGYGHFLMLTSSLNIQTDQQAPIKRTKQLYPVWLDQAYLCDKSGKIMYHPKYILYTDITHFEIYK